jgi:hypothetical protein
VERVEVARDIGQGWAQVGHAGHRVWFFRC